MKKRKPYLRGTLGKPFYNNNIGPNVRRLRLSNDIKQEDCAKALGISRQMLSHYENNKFHVPELVVAKAICYFKITIEKMKGN